MKEQTLYSRPDRPRFSPLLNRTVQILRDKGDQFPLGEDMLALIQAVEEELAALRKKLAVEDCA